MILSFLAVIFAPISYFAFGAAGGYYASFAIVLFLLIFSGEKLSLDIFSDVFFQFFCFVVFVGLVVGFFNVFFYRNEFKSFLIYSAMALAQLLGYAYGFSLRSRGIVASEILKKIGWMELFLLLPRIFVVGVFVRTSLGFTYLLPFVLAVDFRRKLGVFLYGLGLTLFLVAIFLSGLRSVLLPGFFILMVAFFISDVKFILRISAVIPVALFVVLFYIFNIFSLKNTVDAAVNVVAVRMQQTILNDDGARLDPQGGRVEESEFALEEFFRESLILDYAIGRGYGFTFIDREKDGEASAHVHITPVAYFVRGGILGLFFYFVCALLVVRILFSSMLNNLCASYLSYSLVLSVWFFSSLIAGVIIFPHFWFFLGFMRGRVEVLK